MDLAGVNYLAVLVAAVLSWVLGALWYSPVLFSKVWQKEVGLSDSDIAKGNMAMIFGSSFVMMVLMALGMSLMLQAYDGVDWMFGMTQGLTVGVLFVGASMMINYLYQRKSFKLWLIDAGYQIIFLALMGAVIGMWS